jgi:hypothetical protein
MQAAQLVDVKVPGNYTSETEKRIPVGASWLSTYAEIEDVRKEEEMNKHRETSETRKVLKLKTIQKCLYW